MELYPDEVFKFAANIMPRQLPMLCYAIVPKHTMTQRMIRLRLFLDGWGRID